MLPKINRLTKKRDFQAVFQEGRSVKDDFLIFKISKSHLKKSRFGFIVSKNRNRTAKHLTSIPPTEPVIF